VAAASLRGRMREPLDPICRVVAKKIAPITTARSVARKMATDPASKATTDSQVWARSVRLRHFTEGAVRLAGVAVAVAATLVAAGMAEDGDNS
jgi:hypothetical protein